MFSRRNSILIASIVFGAYFFGVGYINSEYRFADKTISENHLETPEQIFEYVTAAKSPAVMTQPILSGQSFIELMSREHDGLWCDEGAIVIAVLNNRLGYRTRLVDLLDSDNHSRHTVLQVRQQDEWITYDFTGRKYGLDPQKTVGFPSRPRYRVFPAFRHEFMLSNIFLRRMGQKIRGLAYGFEE
jgi:hypothetical protein